MSIGLLLPILLIIFLLGGFSGRFGGYGYGYGHGGVGVIGLILIVIVRHAASKLRALFLDVAVEMHVLLQFSPPGSRRTFGSYFSVLSFSPLCCSYRYSPIETTLSVVSKFPCWTMTGCRSFSNGL
jgi:hypothetical protein